MSLFLLFYVVPRFAKIYEDRAAELPFFSQLLIGWGRLVEGHALLALGLLFILPVGIVLLLKNKQARAVFGDLLWRVPALGERLKVYQLARLYRTTGMLLRGGMPLVAALGMSAELLHPVLRQRLAAASRAISEGRSVSESLDTNGLATPVALRMLVVGEQGGNMGEMMERAAGFHDEQRQVATGKARAGVVAQGPLFMAAAADVTGHFYGKLEAPVLRSGALEARWDFSRRIDTTIVEDLSPAALHGRTVNAPKRAVTGALWDGSVHCWQPIYERWAGCSSWPRR